jgi:hypothetical protein
VLVAERPWGFESLRPHPSLGLGAPLVAATAWGLFVAPKASHPTSDPLRLLLEIAVFGSGVAALLAADVETLALVLAALAVLHLALTFVLDQRPAELPAGR